MAICRISAVCNQKGGVGKTTTAHALATGLPYKGNKALAVDLDAQGNLTYAFGASVDKPNIYDLLTGEVIAPRVVQTTGQGAIIASSQKLTRADMAFTGFGREYLLREALEPFRSVYSHIILDCPPTLGILTIDALTAADDLVIPMQSDIFSLMGLSQLVATVEAVRQRSNQALQIAGLLICRYSGRAILSSEVKDTISEKAVQIGTQLYDTVIREGIAIREAQIKRQSLYKTLLKSKPAIDYLSFIDEYLAQASRK